MSPDTKVKLSIMRDGSEKTLSLTLDKMPKQAVARANSGSDKDDNGIDLGKLGLTLAPAGRVAGAGDEGVVVTGVDSDGAAAEHGFATGDVIVEVAGKKVSTPADVRNEIDSVRKEGKRTVLMRVKKNGASRFVALPVKEG